MPNTLTVRSPFDQSPIKDIPLCSAEEAEKKLQKALDLFKDRDSWLAPHERIAILKKFAGLLEKEADAFALLIASEGGKPLIDARVEVARAIDGVGIAIKELGALTGKEIPMGLTPATANRHAFTFYEPIGVVIAVSAFNHPMNLIIHQVIPAIATGCPVIIKPASTTPLNCLRIVELLKEAGLPGGWCEACVCSVKVAESLVTDPRIGFFSFIGSANIGWQLRAKLAPGVRCALEHGGVAPVIVDDNIALDQVVPSLAKGGFYHAGQVCVSVQRVFAHQNIARPLAEALAKTAEILKTGDAREADTEVGPLILPKEVTRVHEWVQEAINEGAEALCGATPLSETTYAPTVLWNPSPKSIISTHEIFGPVVCVYPYEDRNQAITQANALDYAFQAAVYTNDLNIANDTANRLDATAVMINDHTAFRADWMPFGGRRHSGYGMGGIGYTMHDMVVPKMVVYSS